MGSWECDLYLPIDSENRFVLVIVFLMNNFCSLSVSDEGDGTTSPLDLPLANSEHDESDSDSDDFSDKGKSIHNSTFPYKKPLYHKTSPV